MVVVAEEGLEQTSERIHRAEEAEARQREVRVSRAGAERAEVVLDGECAVDYNHRELVAGREEHREAVAALGVTVVCGCPQYFCCRC